MLLLIRSLLLFFALNLLNLMPRMLEMALQKLSDFKLFWGACPQTP